MRPIFHGPKVVVLTGFHCILNGSKAFRTNFHVWCCFLCIQVSFDTWKTKGNLKNLQFWPESLGSMLKYWYIERGLLYLVERPGGILSSPLKSCKDEASLMTLSRMAFHTMRPLYLTLFLPRSLLYRIREKSFMRPNLYLLKVLPVADSDLQLRGRGCVFVLLALPAFLPSVISSFFTQNKGGPPVDPPLVTYPKQGCELLR